MKTNADRVGNRTPSETSINYGIPSANSSGKLSSGWGGAASSLATLDGSSLVVQNPANATATPTASKIPIADGSGKLDGWVTVALTKRYESTEQTITSGGALTLAHGFGVEPFTVQVWLVCQTAEFNYSVGDKLLAINEISDSVSDNHGYSIVADATNLNIRFGAGAAVFNALNKTTGAGVNLTNTNWKAVFRALA